MPPPEVAVDLGEVLNTLNMVEYFSRAVRENTALAREAQTAAQRPTLELAGAAVLNQLQQGNNRVILPPQQGNEMQKMAQMHAMASDQSMQSLMQCFLRLQQMLTPKQGQPPAEGGK